MVKKELKNLDVITLRNGEKLVFVNEEFADLNDDYTNNVTDLDDFKDDLTSVFNIAYDVIKVDRAMISGTIFEREEPVKMTVSEICEKLGYNVEIVKENNND